MQNPAKIEVFATQITKQNPSLNVLIDNEGIMKMENLKKASDDFVIAKARGQAKYEEMSQNFNQSMGGASTH